MSTTAKPQLVDRASFLGSTRSAQGDFKAIQTPELENGALRSGGAPSLLSRESFGLLAQYAAVGLVYGALPGTIYPFLTAYLNMEGQQTASATALLSIPWSLKVFIGMVSDNFPIFGYRRRPYMMLGWTVAALCLFIMAFMPMPDPYFVDGRQRHIPIKEFEKHNVQVRANAPNSGGKYIMLMMFASLGYVIADVAADAVVVEYAQREPEEIRGRTQTAIYTTRTVFQIFSALFLAFGLNSHDYGGTFGSALKFSTVMLVLGLFCVPVIPMTWFFVREERFPRQNFGEYIQRLWTAIQTRAFYQVIAYNFFSGVLSGITYVASSPIQIYWVEATNLNDKLATIFGNLVMAITLVITAKIGLQWNWRVVIATTMIAVVALDAIVTMITTWDLLRNPWFWFGVPVVENVPGGIQFIISTFVVVELAGEGNEGACYGLLTTVTNLASPFATSITKNINGPFSVWNSDIQADSHHVRMDVTYTILISYACKLASLGLLGLLPRQKAETQELKRTGGSSRLMGGITVAYCMFALVWSIMTNVFSIFESTKCFKITGGCKQ